MEKQARIFVAGHRGLVGSALVAQLLKAGYDNLLLKTHAELDLTDDAQVHHFFAANKPEYVFLAAAKVGGIHANSAYPAEFIQRNLAIQTNVIHRAWQHNTKRLLFLGSSCIYPKRAPQPIQESCLLTSPLESSNRPYALAKIAGIEMCWSYNRQYGTRYLAAMPTNLYGAGDNYHAENSHVIPGLIRRFCEAAQRGDDEVVIWGDGTPRREFLHNSDLAAACLFLMNLPNASFDTLLGSYIPGSDHLDPPLINVGVGHDITIRELAECIKGLTAFTGKIRYDPSKPNGSPRKLLDIGKITNLGWQAQIPLRDGLSMAIADFQQTYLK